MGEPELKDSKKPPSAKHNECKGEAWEEEQGT